MIPTTIADLIITRLKIRYGQKIGSKVENVQDMTKSIIDNLPELVQTSQELQVRLQERLTALKYRPRLYETLTIDLSTARSKEKFDVTGSYIVAQSITGELQVRFNEQDNDPVTVNGDNRIFEINFDTLYITNTAQSGKSVTFIIGKAGAFAGSAITPMTFNEQNVGVYLQPEWAAKTGIDKSFRAYSASRGHAEAIYASYAVPAGKTLFVTHISGMNNAVASADANNNQMCHGYVYVTTTGTYLATVGGNGGFFASFSKPVVITEGQTVWFGIRNNSSNDCECEVTAFAYEV